MKSRIHPVSRPVVFRDRAADVAFLTRSTADSGERVTWEDGNTYPVIDVETSSASHPFYTGAVRCSTRQAASSGSVAATAPRTRPAADGTGSVEGGTGNSVPWITSMGAGSREQP